VNALNGCNANGIVETRATWYNWIDCIVKICRVLDIDFIKSLEFHVALRIISDPFAEHYNPYIN